MATLTKRTVKNAKEKIKKISKIGEYLKHQPSGKIYDMEAILQ